MEKTGTTAIQGFLYQNLQLLADEFNILIPTWEGDISVNTHHRISKAFVPNKKMTPQHKIINIESFKTILKGFEESKYFEKLIISSELFSYSTAKEINELKDTLQNFDVTIIVFLRRQDQYIESLYNQHIKRIWIMGRPPTDAVDFCKSKKLDFNKFVLQWYENGFENIDLKIYGLSKAKDYIFHQFFENIDPAILENENVIIRKETANPSLSLFHTILVNEYLPKVKDELLRKKAAQLIFDHNMFYARITNNQILTKKTHYSKEFKTELLAKYEASNNKILSLFPNSGFSKHSLFQPAKEFSEPLSINDLSKEKIMMFFFNLLLYVINSLSKKDNST